MLPQQGRAGPGVGGSSTQGDGMRALILLQNPSFGRSGTGVTLNFLQAFPESL
jgi:hypothetical protein